MSNNTTADTGFCVCASTLAPAQESHENKNISAGDVIVFVALTLWFAAFAVFAKKRRYDMLVIAFMRWAIGFLVALCAIANECQIWDQETLAKILGQLQNAWTASGIQLMTNQLPDQLRWVQYFVLLFGGVVTGVFLEDQTKPWGVSLEVLMTLTVIPVNWFLTGQHVDLRLAKFYAPLLMIGISYIGFLLTIETSPLGANTIWETGFMLTTAHTFVSKAQWDASFDRTRQLAEQSGVELPGKHSTNDDVNATQRSVDV